MEEFITDERTGLRYELVGDYYLIAGEDEPEGRPIGIWGQRHLRYIRTAQGRGFATPTVQKPISKPKKKRNAMESVANELIYR